MRYGAKLWHHVQINGLVLFGKGAAAFFNRGVAGSFKAEVKYSYSKFAFINALFFISDFIEIIPTILFLCSAKKAFNFPGMRISLKTKLFTGIALAILFVLTLSVISYYTSVKEREGEAAISHTIQVRSHLRDISINLKDYTSSIRTLRRYESATNLYDNITPGTITESVEQLKALVRDNPAQQRMIEELSKKLAAVFTLWQNTDLHAARVSQEVEKDYYSQEVALLEQINWIIHTMDGHEADLLKERQRHTLRLLDFSNFANIGGTIIILFIVVLLSISIKREFVKRMVAEKKLKENLLTLETLNARTADNNEVLNGAQRLIAACQQAPGVRDFLRTMLGAILEFTQSAAAVVYLFDETETDKVRPIIFKGTAAPDMAGSISTEQFPVDLKQSGQNVFFAKHVPEHFWRITTGLGSATAGTLCYVILQTPDRRLGVVELAKFGEPTKKEIDYLEMIAPAISVRLAGVQIGESRNELLAQLQEHQEVLINQQEELRLANEELTHQTQVLQASEEELRVQEEELKQINVELEQKNVAIESAREVLTMKAAELEASGKYKSEFLANMSHELRTPLNSVLILASLLKDSKEQNLTPKQVEYASIIHKSGSDLLKLINDILDLSKIESGKADLNLEDIPLKSVKESMHQLFDVLAEQQDVHFKISIDPDAPERISSDRQKLEQIIKNLLSNAFKFTPKKGTVSLTIRPDTNDKTRILFEVKDTGIGIPEDKQAIVFEAFKQADGSTNRKYGGTGLGLSISRELARVLGGNIHLSSRENIGSNFTVQLPLQNDMPGTAPLNEPSQKATLPVADLARTLPLIEGKGKTILIIEDDSNFSAILQTFAEDRQYRTIRAFDGAEGLALAEQHRPDAIILDMQLPVMNGWEILKRLKDHPQLKSVPVHVISASDDVQMPLQGAIAYLKKPVSKEALENAFSLIGLKVYQKGKRMLLLKGTALKGNLLDNFLNNVPADIEVDIADDMESAIRLGDEQEYGCIVADIGKDIEAGIDNIERLRSETPFQKTSVIIFIDKEISQAEEAKLSTVSEAVVMNSREAYRRLADELELFLHKLDREEPATPKIRAADRITTGSEVLRGKKVLLADDDMRNVFALVSLLEEQGMEVSTAGNGQEAVTFLKEEEQPDIVLMDIMMPEMDGYEAMKIIRNRLQLRQLPIIAITAKAMAEDRELCIAAGASDYISKPVDNQKLLSLMRVWLSQ